MSGARYFAVDDPLRPGELSSWRRHTVGTDAIEPGQIEPWPARRRKTWTWGMVRRDDVPAEILGDEQALERWLNELEANALRTVADAINANPQAAALAFARRVTRCCCCAKILTDETSTAYGIGPECRRKIDPDLLARLALLGAS